MDCVCAGVVNCQEAVPNHQGVRAIVWGCTFGMHGKAGKHVLVPCVFVDLALLTPFQSLDSQPPSSAFPALLCCQGLRCWQERDRMKAPSPSLLTLAAETLLAWTPPLDGPNISPIARRSGVL